MDLSFLPGVNAALNGVAAVLLTAGFVFIKRKRMIAHRNCMIGAFTTSCVFLITYVTHYVWRAQVAGGTHTKFNGEGVIKLLYYLMLLTHVLLAMAVPFLAVTLIVLGLKRRDAAHRRVAAFALPIWMYVSITGVLIYFALYHFNPSGVG